MKLKTIMVLAGMLAAFTALTGCQQSGSTSEPVSSSVSSEASAESEALSETDSSTTDENKPDESTQDGSASDTESETTSEEESSQVSQYEAPEESLESSDYYYESGEESEFVWTTSMNIYPVSVSLMIGDSKQLSVLLRPGNASKTDLYWSSDDPGIALVNSEGKVTAIAKGSTTIHVSNGYGLESSCIVGVKDGTEISGESKTDHQEEGNM